MKKEKSICKPVDSDNWKDFEDLFESKGAPKYCWCMAWRNMQEGADQQTNAGRKASIKHYVNEKLPIGLLYYEESEPVAWCSVAPKETFRELSSDKATEGVWSLVCFFVKKEFRKRGLMEKLIAEAGKYAKKNGAKTLEAYPVDPDSPSYRFMGFKPVFEKSGFTVGEKVGKRRHVASKEL